MEDNLIGYLLDALDPETHRQTEAYLDRSPAARQQLELLRRSLAPLALDNEASAPPPDLVVRTLAHVAEFCCQDLPHAPPQPPAQKLSFSLLPFRRMDVLVAACLLVLVGGLGGSWVYWMNVLYGRTACQNDLKEMYVALDAYRTKTGNFPNVNEVAQPPKNVTGLVVPMLVSQGYLPKDFKISCPGEKPVGLPVPYDSFVAMDMSEFNRRLGSITPYGYSLGYRDSNGVIHGPAAPPGDGLMSQLALMADAPPADLSLGNSPNHGFRGQNVLYTDGHCEFAQDRKVGFGGDDIYTNQFNKVEAGVDPHDSVIGGPLSKP